MSDAVWPLTDLRIECGDVRLRPVCESDLPHLVVIRPDDYGHDPRAEMFPGLTPRQNWERLVYQGYWRARGTWSPSSWCLDMAVEFDGAVVGVQSLEAENFPVLRTVDSGSWLVPAVRGRGLGVAMRTAVLALAFDHLGALAAVSSAESGNAASLGVSRRIGYVDNGVSLNDSGAGPIELRHVRLTADRWRAQALGARVVVHGLAPCLPWFGR